MLNKILKTSSPFLLSFVLGSCSIAGTWVYERLDNYLADYFKEFANFSKEQNKEIDRISESYLDWFSETELPEIKILLEDLKNLNYKTPEESITSAYEAGEDIFQRTNQYFEKPIIGFSKSLSNQQISEIESHFQKLAEERAERRRKDSENYLDEIYKNYVSGFDRIGISLRDDQEATLKLMLNRYVPLREEWSLLQNEWVEKFIQLLYMNDAYAYETDMSLFLRSFEEIGDENFREKSDANQTLVIDIIIYVISSSDTKQIKSFQRSMDIYLNSINRILSKRSVN
ncbi:MAG: DUF6279 family lipoprotein [SAR86 cluster bacterium]|nr:DUF6279 family lipoprotein [SAR86 cluster bacterium]